MTNPYNLCYNRVSNKEKRAAMNTVKTLSDDELWNIIEDLKADLKAGKTLSDYARNSWEDACLELGKRGWR